MNNKNRQANSERGNNMSKMPPPILLSSIICDRVIIDKITGMPTLVNIIQNIRAVNFPTRTSSLIYFCELTNGRGKTEATLRLVESKHKENILFEQKSNIEFKDVKQVLTMTLNLQGIIFPAEGEYRFQLLVGETILGERRIQCVKGKKKTPPGKKE